MHLLFQMPRPLGSETDARDDDDGTVEARQLTYPFGAERSGGTRTLPTEQAYTGQWSDPIGLYDYCARW